MLQDILNDDEYVSLSGKLWISGVPYDFEADEMLNDDEKLYIDIGGIPFYTYSEGNRKVSISYPYFKCIKTLKEAIIAFRKIAKTLLKSIPNQKYIIINDDGFETAVNQEIKPLVLKTLDGGYQTIKIISKNDDYNIAYKWIDDYITNLNKNTNGRYNNVTFYVIDEYLIKFSPYTRPMIANLWKCFEDDKVRPWMLVDSGNDDLKYYRANIKYVSPTKATTFIGDESPVLTSPPVVPSNAFLISPIPEFIQFTRSGVIVTNGIFFAKNKNLEEVRKPWYIVEKTKEGWEIYYIEPGMGSHHYKIVDGKLFEFDHTALDYVEITINEKERHYKRDKLARGDKILYIPKSIVDELVGDQI